MIEAAASAPPSSRPRRALRRLRRNPRVLVGSAIIGLVVLTAIFADFIATHPPIGFFPDDVRLGPSAEHWFGTDVLGRDVFSRVVHGSRSALALAGAVVALVLLVGLTIGGLAGYVGGWVDAVLSRTIDAFLAFPVLIGATIIAVGLGRGRAAVVVGIAAFSWVTVARLFRSNVIVIREAGYVEAARVLGAGNLRIFLRHVLPGSIGPTLVYASALIGTALVAEAALSFLGLGVQEPDPSWGLMIANGRQFLRTLSHVVLFPGGALALTVFGFVMLGEGLRDALDPRSRR